MPAIPNIPFNHADLFAPGERLPAIKSWLLNSIWTKERYLRLDSDQFLRTGEAEVARLEELISTGATQVWDELQADSQRAPTVSSWLGLDRPLLPVYQSTSPPIHQSTNPAAPTSSIHDAPSAIHHPSSTIHHPPFPRAAVILDGLSLRELPLILQLAESSGLTVKSAQPAATCLPSETINYVNERVIGTRIGPSQLRGRTELAQKNTEAFYFEHPNSRYTLPAEKNLLLWSTYPDRLFADDNARTEALFATIHRDYLPTVWQCTTQAIPRGVPTVITSDHGYIFLGASLEANRSSDAMEILGQARFREFTPHDHMPAWHPDLQLLPQTRYAMLRGRLRTRPTGPSSRKLYQHGGFSLMEVLVPWIELEPR